MLVDKLYYLVLSISVDIENHVSEIYKSEGMPPPPRFRHEVFTTAAYDSIEHNPSYNTALEALHGTGIASFQHQHAIQILKKTLLFCFHYAM